MLHSPSYHPLPQDIMSATLVAQPPKFFSLSSSLPHVPSSGYPQPAGWLDLVRVDPLKARDSHSLEMFKRVKRRSRIEGAAPARKVDKHDTTPGPVSVEQGFAGEEPEPVEEDLAGEQSGPSAEDLRDGLAEQAQHVGLRIR